MIFYAQLMFTEINECSEVICSNGGTCIDKIDSYVCLCVDGYEGHTCDMNKNDCNGYPCLNGGTCQDEIYGYQCSCAFGYTGNSCGEGMFSKRRALQIYVTINSISLPNYQPYSLKNSVHDI